MNEKNKLYQCRNYLFCNFELLQLPAYQIAKDCNCSMSTIQIWLRKFNIKRKTSNFHKKMKLINLKTCKHCNQNINVKIIEHINIESDPKILYFCSKECKFLWIFKNSSLD